MSATRSLLLLGGGGHAAVVADAARAAGFDVIGALDDNEAAADSLARVDLAWLGTLDDLAVLRADLPAELAVHAAVGHNPLRRTWLMMMNDNHADLAMPPIVHPSAIVAPSATIGDGVYVGPGAIVNARAVIGPGVIVNSGVIVEHDCNVGAYTHLAPRSALGGGARVGEGVMVGLGAALLPGVSVGDEATIGAGAAVTTDIPGRVTAIGVPAKVVAPAVA